MVCSFSVGLAPVCFVVVVVAVVGGACGAGGEVEVGEVQTFAATIAGAAGA